jgi:hypothetical protein
MDLMRQYFQVVTTLAIGFLTLSLISASAQSLSNNDQCALYDNVVATSTSSTAVIPDELLVNWKVALNCLVPAVANLRVKINGPILSPDVRNKLVSITAAIRKIMATLSPGATDSANLTEFIRAYREINNLSATSVLVFGARSNDEDARLNSMLILANVIDNRNVCVPLDHLYDPDLGVKNVDYSIKGQANLLAIVSVVAPWAYRENYDNIQTMVTYVSQKVDLSLQQTVDILKNIKVRLASQTDDTNKGAWLPDFAKDCEKYIPTWANNSGIHLKYRSN